MGLYGYEKSDGIRQRRSDKKNCVAVYLKLSISTDSDIIKKLEECGNKQGYIKSLIRADLQNE